MRHFFLSILRITIIVNCQRKQQKPLCSNTFHNLQTVRSSRVFFSSLWDCLKVAWTLTFSKHAGKSQQYFQWVIIIIVIIDFQDCLFQWHSCWSLLQGAQRRLRFPSQGYLNSTTREHHILHHGTSPAAPHTGGAFHGLEGCSRKL